jgi:pyruvate kinase
VMVARGDLGVEIDVAQLPIVQKRIIASCHEHQKPVIIATQMLDSMQHSRLPTRAEVTDVANAILDGGDACMLSGETAIGQYPIESVSMMQRVALATEELFHDNVPKPPGNFRVDGLHAITAAVVYGASHVAAEIDARAIIVASHSGATALAISKQRNYVRAIGSSDQPHVLRQMCLYWGVIPLAGIATGSHQEIFKGATAWGRSGGVLSPGDHVVLVAGTGLGDKSHDQIVVYRVE